MNIWKGIGHVLPKEVKAFLHPFYRVFIRRVPDRPSGLIIGSFGGFEIAYRKNTADKPVIEETIDKDIFFSGVPEYQPNEEHVIIDIGAHIGTFSLLASSKARRGKVYAVEASEDSFNL
jgi:hypothetical protein